MKQMIFFFAALTGITGITKDLYAKPSELKTKEVPIIIFILVDDLGYGELSCYNLRTLVKTPNTDRVC